MKKALLAVVVLLAACSPADTKVAEQAVSTFHELLDAGKFQSIYDQSATDLREVATKQDFVALLDAVHRKLGLTKTFNLDSKSVNYSPSGTLVTLKCTTTFAEGEASEEFVYQLEDGKAVLDGYHINANALILK
jgi:hypothetical protein